MRNGEIREALDGAHFVGSISKEVLGETRARLGQPYSQTIQPREVLRLYLEGRNVPEDRAEVMMRHAEGLMEEQPPS